MALEIKGMKRVFKMKKNSQEIVLDDPNVNMSPAEVMDFYSMNYPELTTATVHGPEIEDVPEPGSDRSREQQHRAGDL